ncbi:hypothetical protein HDE_09598 [Halotydeus destructor]|nr:hypothetical protein HDE_09598 [Halotydeus destructor]
MKHLTLTLVLTVMLASQCASLRRKKANPAFELIKLLLNPEKINRIATGNDKQPLLPLEPEPLNPSLDVLEHIFNLLEGARHMENTIKKRTYSYGLDVVGRPLQELTVGQKILRAVLMPNKYYHDIADNLFPKAQDNNNATDSGSESTESIRRQSPGARISKSLITRFIKHVLLS